MWLGDSDESVKVHELGAVGMWVMGLTVPGGRGQGNTGNLPTSQFCYEPKTVNVINQK